jgi:hypothetical protein
VRWWGSAAWLLSVIDENDEWAEKAEGAWRRLDAKMAD